MRKSLLLLIFCAACAIAAPAVAQLIQQRFLPAEGIRGKLGDTQPLPLVMIGKDILRMAPGAIIYDRSNRFIVHSNLPAGAEILFTRDQAGNVQRIYILTDDEQARLKAAGKS